MKYKCSIETSKTRQRTFRKDESDLYFERVSGLRVLRLLLIFPRVVSKTKTPKTKTRRPKTYEN